MSESSLWEKLIKYRRDLWPLRLRVETPKQGMEQVSEETVSNHFLEGCHIKKKAFYSSLGHSNSPVQ